MEYFYSKIFANYIPDDSLLVKNTTQGFGQVNVKYIYKLLSGKNLEQTSFFSKSGSGYFLTYRDLSNFMWGYTESVYSMYLITEDNNRSFKYFISYFLKNKILNEKFKKYITLLNRKYYDNYHFDGYGDKIKDYVRLDYCSHTIIYHYGLKNFYKYFFNNFMSGEIVWDDSKTVNQNYSNSKYIYNFKKEFVKYIKGESFDRPFINFKICEENGFEGVCNRCKYFSISEEEINSDIKKIKSKGIEVKCYVKS